MPLSGSAFWGLILPVEKQNLLQNPSGERGTFGWGTALVSGGGTVGTTSAFQQFGAWAGSCAPTGNASQGGARLGTWTSGNGTAYTASAYIRGGVGSAYALRVTSNDESGVLNSTTFTTGGTWHRYTVNYTENSDTTRVLTIGRNGAGADAFYFDGAQVEVGSLTTFVDGDQDGCYWLGAPHQSQSVRSGTYRGGGSVVALADLGLRPNDNIGIGMPPQDVTAQSYALQAGAEYQRSRASERPFTLTFQPILGTTLKDFHVTRRTIINAIKPDLVSPQQPVRFWYTGGQGTVQIDAVYHSGLELGQMDGPMAEDGGVKFIAHDPYWTATTQQGTALNPRLALGSANYIAKRDPLLGWGTLGVQGTTVNNDIRALGYFNGTVFLGGAFGSAGGTAAGALAFYSEFTDRFGTMGGTVQATGVNAITVDPNGTVIFGGGFTNISGLSNTRFIARWANGFATITGGTTGAVVNALAWTGGTLAIGGDFAVAGGTTTGALALWTSAGYGSTTNGTVSLVQDVAVGLDRRIFVTNDGAITAGGTSVNYVAQWNGAWGSMTTGLQGAGAGGAALAVGPNGVVYVGGGFGSAGGGSAQNVAQWNGVQWSAMGPGLAILSPGAVDVGNLLTDQLTGNVYAFELSAANSGPTTFPDAMAMWNGYQWLPLDVDFQNPLPTTGLIAVDRTLYVAGEFTGTAHAAGVAQVVNSGMGVSYPIFKARNPSAAAIQLYQLTNMLTSDAIYFNNLSIQPGEEVTLTTEPGQRSFTSSFAGNIFGAIIPGSNLSSFALLPGTNWVSCFASSGSIATSIYWTPRSDSADGGTIY